MDVLNSLRELERFRVKTADGQTCGRIKDVYFNDLTWTVRHLVLSIEPSPFGRKQVLLNPGQVECFSRAGAGLNSQLTITADEAGELPRASSVLPVCQQYAAFAVSSRGAGLFEPHARRSNPHLRSARSVMTHRVEGPGEFFGRLSDLLVDDECREIRYLAVEQLFEKKKLNFHILPQSVERITWSTQRVVLRELQPVAVGLGEVPVTAAHDFAGTNAA